MPHIIVKHSLSDALDILSLLKDLHETLAGHETIKKTDIKTHAIALQHVIVGGDDQPDTMIHIQILMKSGRSEILKKTISSSLHDVARRHADQPSIYAVSVEIVELDTATYFSSYKK